MNEIQNEKKIHEMEEKLEILGQSLLQLRDKLSLMENALTKFIEKNSE